MQVQTTFKGMHFSAILLQFESYLLHHFSLCHLQLAFAYKAKKKA